MRAFPAAIPSAVAIALIAFWMKAATNAFNFMDGIDGIAAGQAMVAGLGWATVGYLIGSKEVSLVGLLGAAAPAGFLLTTGRRRRIAHSNVAVLYCALAVIGAIAAVALASDRPRAGVVSAIVLGLSAVGLWRYVVFRETATAL